MAYLNEIEMAIHKIPFVLEGLFKIHGFQLTSIEDTDIYSCSFNTTHMKVIVNYSGISLYIDDVIEIEHAPLNVKNTQLITDTITDELVRIGIIPIGE